MLSLVAASGDRAIAIVILGSIVIPLAALGWLCWFFWKHRHDATSPGSPAVVLRAARAGEAAYVFVSARASGITPSC